MHTIIGGVMPKKSRTKGKSGELEVVNLLRVKWPDVCRNLDQYQKTSGRDLNNTQPWCIQIKRQRRVTDGDRNTAYVEASSAIDHQYERPVVVHRSDKGKWKAFWRLDNMMVETYLSDWLEVS